ncbi:hypothetical protein D9619_004348 [Psilocybe cf. subviscida]|uniref:Enoyl reductase (ER) domain-containing protein n=1 Tax=Psilocybe cf. subviscida TaxID=2480587 RepID=A0A8H5BQX1_9AGAR|nr:hypothetical protein D9619_004348 [Psilocybe cf. subviscida]
MTPSVQKALYTLKKKGEFIVGDIIPVPTPGPGEVLVKVMAAGLNPGDWKVREYGEVFEEFPAVFGFDYAGVIEQLGEGVEGFKVGDRVFTESAMTNGHGGFQQYALAVASTLPKIPDNISFEEASTLGVALTTAYVGLYQSLPDGFGLPEPTPSRIHQERRGPFVVLGGSTSCGQVVMQFAKLSGFDPIIATASLSNTESLKAVGATHVFARNLSAEELLAKISSVTSEPLKYVFDVVSSEQTENIGMSILAEGGHFATLSIHPGVKPQPSKGLIKVKGWLRIDKNIPLLEPFYRNHATEFLGKGLIKSNAIEVLPNGLHGIPDGLKRLQNFEVSKMRLVAHPQDTI